MQMKTILHCVQNFKFFVHTEARWSGSTLSSDLEMEVAERVKGRLVCSGCDQPRPGYDRLPRRCFEFVLLWVIKVFLVYYPRRVACPDFWVRVEWLTWASDNHDLTHAYAWVLSRWARRLSWKEVAEVFQTSRDSVFRSVEMAVEWGRAHQYLTGTQSTGIDEISG